MLRLQTLGGLALVDSAGAVTVTQRHRLALLALLATHADRGLTRDQLVAYLWPESATDAARHGLDQLLYALRRHASEDLFLGTDPLRLNPNVITSDVAAFEGAIARGADTEAVAVYRGPFLDGSHFRESAEFEQWVAGERSRLAGQYAAAVERLAKAATEIGDHPAALEAWRKLAALDPLSSRSALGLLRALDACDDRPEALRYARTYEALVSGELGTGPDPAVQRFVQELRTPHPVASAIRDAAPRFAPDQPATAVLPRLRGTLIGSLAIAVMAMAGIWVAGRIGDSSPRAALDPNRVLVVPFRVTGADSTTLYLREGLADLMAARLTGDGGPSAVDPRTALSAWRRAAAAAGRDDVPQDTVAGIARGLGAGQILLGEVVIAPGGRLVLSGRIVRSVDGRTGPQASVTGRTQPTDSLLAAVDQLVTRLLILRAGEDPQRLASLLTTSPQALDAFLRGRAESRLGHDAAARSYFARALDHDSSFALAALELALARGWLFRWTLFASDSGARTVGVQFGGGAPTRSSDEDQWHRAMELAWRGRARLSRADRAVLMALRGERHPGPSFAREMLLHWERAVRAAPDRPDVHYTLGSVLLSQGPAMGLADSRARAAASFRHALELDSAFLSPVTGLVEIAALERDTVMLPRLQALYLGQDSLSGEADYVRWLVAAALRDEIALRAIRSRFPSLDLGILTRIARTSQMHGIALEDAERAFSVALGRTHERQQRQIVLWYAGFLALNRGRPDRALQLMRLKREVDPGPDLERGFAIRYALWWDGDSLAGAGAAQAIQPSLSPSARVAPAEIPGTVAARGLSLALWRLWHEDTTGASDAIRHLRDDRRHAQADAVDALLAGIVGRPDAAEALAKLDSTALLGCCGPYFINLVSARLHDRAGDLPGALAAIRRGRWLFPPQYLSTYLREEGRLAALTGDTAGAIAAYRHYLTLRSDPEPSLQPAADRVRAELARLERGP